MTQIFIEKLKTLFINIILRRFAKCTRLVKLRLLRSYCLFYDISLWTNFGVVWYYINVLICVSVYINFYFLSYSFFIHFIFMVFFYGSCGLIQIKMMMMMMMMIYDA